ncbi:hypothetical protein [Gordonia rhizosphera]|nr:hypothetical protein [Gordonia rhizosphera]
MSSVNRTPAIGRNRHPGEDLPERPQPASPNTSAGDAPPVSPPPARSTADRTQEERMTEQHNVRIRPSVKERAFRAVSKLRYETGDSSISLQSITDQALDEYLKKHGC